MKLISKIRFCFEWRFLPVRFQRWLFGTATRVVEFLSALGLFGFAVVFMTDNDVLYNYPIYYKFKDINETALICTFLFASVSQAAAMFYWSNRSNVISGWLLMFGSFLWFLISVAFLAPYPPLNTGMVLPPLMSFVCMLAGHNMLNFSILAEKMKGRVSD